MIRPGLNAAPKILAFHYNIITGSMTSDDSFGISFATSKMGLLIKTILLMSRDLNLEEKNNISFDTKGQNGRFKISNLINITVKACQTKASFEFQ